MAISIGVAICFTLVVATCGAASAFREGMSSTDLAVIQLDIRCQSSSNSRIPIKEG
jgi:hypothetical protein